MQHNYVLLGYGAYIMKTQNVSSICKNIPPVEGQIMPLSIYLNPNHLGWHETVQVLNINLLSDQIVIKYIHCLLCKGVFWLYTI